ncbi:MAG: hypothetical protein QM690_17535 [Sphingobium sp.]
MNRKHHCAHDVMACRTSTMPSKAGQPGMEAHILRLAGRKSELLFGKLAIVRAMACIAMRPMPVPCSAGIVITPQSHADAQSRRSDDNCLIAHDKNPMPGTGRLQWISSG